VRPARWTAGGAGGLVDRTWLRRHT
jgi:hypothetical protein